MVTFSISRIHQAFTHEFAWSSESDRSYNSDAPNELTCGVIDSVNQNLYIGQSRGHICQLNLLELGTHSPRLLGKHDGLVKSLCMYTYAGNRTQKPVNLVASCSADSTIKIWAHDPKVLHSTKPCLQTLYGHTAAVTCISAVHQYLVSGAADGSVLLWKTTDTGLLAVPHFQVAAKLWSSSHWVLSLSCQQQPADAGAGQGLFVAVANMSLLRIQFDKRKMQCSDTGQIQVQVFGGPQSTSISSSSGSNSKSTLKGAANSSPSPVSSSPGSLASHAISFNNNTSNGDNSDLQPSHSNTVGSSGPLPQNAASTPRSQDLSIFAVKYLAHDLAVLTLAYDGCCRLHSAVDGGVRCAWWSPARSKFVAVDSTGSAGEVLIGDDLGALHVCSLHSEQLLGIKQIAQTPITAIICCGNRTVNKPSGCSAQAGSSYSCERSVTEFVVLSGEGMGLWRLQQGLSYDVLPGGHKQSVLAVQICQAHVQLDLSVLQLHSFADAAATTPSTRSTSLPPPQSAGSTSDSAGDATADTAAASAAVQRSPGSLKDVYTLFSAGLDNRVLQWDLAQGPSVLSGVDAGEGGLELSAMTYLQNWAVLATGHEDGQIRLWRMDTGSFTVLGSSVHNNTVCCLAPCLTSKGDELLLSGDYDGCVVLWEPRPLRGAKPHMLTRFRSFGLTTEELVESYQLARLADSSDASNSAADRSRLQSARRRRPATTSTGGASGGTPGGSTAGSNSPSSTRTPQLGAQRLADVGVNITSSSTESLLQKAATGGGSGMSASSMARQLQRQPPALVAGPTKHGSNQFGSRVGTSLGSPSSQTKQDLLTRPTPHQLQQQSIRGSSPGLQSGRNSPHGCSVPASAALQGILGAGPTVVESPEVLVIMFDTVQQVVVTGGNSGVIRVWSSSCMGELLGQHLGHTGPVNCLTIDGNFLFSGSSDRSVRMWDLLPPQFASKGSSSAGQAAGTNGPDSVERATGVSTFDGGVGFAAGSAVSSWEHYLEEIGSGSTPTSAGRDGSSQLASCMTRGSHILKDIVPRSIAFEVLQGHTAAVTGLDMVRSTGVLVSCGKDGRILQWDYTAGQMLAEQQLSGMEFTCLSVQQESKQAYVGTSKGRILGFKVAAPAV